MKFPKKESELIFKMISNVKEPNGFRMTHEVNGKFGIHKIKTHRLKEVPKVSHVVGADVGEASTQPATLHVATNKPAAPEWEDVERWTMNCMSGQHFSSFKDLAAAVAIEYPPTKQEEDDDFGA